jgi:large subunit ribosomal protein L18
MNKAMEKKVRRVRRHARVRTKVSGTATRPRLAVFRSNRFIYAQLIDDQGGKTLLAADSRNEKGKSARERAAAVGKIVAEEALKQKIETVVFDRGGFQYQGVIVALADGARKAGLTF